MATANDNLLRQTVRAQIDLHRYSNSVVQDILSLLNAADKELVAKLRARMDAGKGGSWSSGRLRVLIKELAEISAEGYRNAQDRLFDEMVGFAEHEAEHTAAAIEAQKPPVDGLPPKTAAKINAVFSIVQPTAEQLAAMVSKEPITVGPQGKLLFEEIFKGLADGKENRIRQAIRLGMVEGEGTDQIVRRLVGTRAQRYADGIIERDRRGAEAMVRTIVNHTSNRAMGAIYSANADIIKGVQWVSTLDGRTTLICIQRDGMTFPTNDGPRPPAHVNCRSVCVPVLKSWREMGIDMDEIPPSTRASMNGQVSAKLTYGEWLKEQSPEMVKDVLGATRAKLFLQGDMPVQAFVNDKGQTLTLAQLREKKAGYFKKAGV